MTLHDLALMGIYTVFLVIFGETLHWFLNRKRKDSNSDEQ